MKHGIVNIGGNISRGSVQPPRGMRESASLRLRQLATSRRAGATQPLRRATNSRLGKHVRRLVFIFICAAFLSEKFDWFLNCLYLNINWS